MLPLIFPQHLLAINALDAVFLVDLRNVFLFVLMRKKIRRTRSVEIASDCLRFVVNFNMPRQLQSHLLAVDALQQISCFVIVLLQNVFFPLLLRLEERAAIFKVFALNGLFFCGAVERVSPFQWSFFCSRCRFSMLTYYIVS